MSGGLVVAGGSVVAGEGDPVVVAAVAVAAAWGSGGVEPRDFTSNFPIRLRALYAQLFRTTLAPFVLPRLLARS